MSEQASSEIVSQRHFVVRAVLRTDTGLVRSENQDFGTYTTTPEEQASHPGGRLLIVADGMGGHRGGATASRLAGETVKAQYLDSETTDIATALRESLTRANARIYSEAQSNPDLRGMGTTTSVLAVRGDYGWIAHVGDSRIYLVRNDEIQQLTDDHSLVATMVREGLLTSAEAETHPRRNVLQRSMGVSEEVEIDVRGPMKLQEGDTFILCSDGLHGVVKEQELKEIVKGSIEAAADDFVKRALERGAPDNVTVIVARVETSDDPADGYLAEKWEETQPLQHLDETAFDETVKESQLLDVSSGPDDDEETARLPVPVVEAAATAGAATAGGATAGPAIEPEPQKSTVTQPAAEAGVAPQAIAPQTAARTVSSPPRPAARPQPRKRSFLRWVLVLLLILGAAGAWWYRSQLQAWMEGSFSSSR